MPAVTTQVGMEDGAELVRRLSAAKTAGFREGLPMQVLSGCVRGCVCRRS